MKEHYYSRHYVLCLFFLLFYQSTYGQNEERKLNIKEWLDAELMTIEYNTSFDIGSTADIFDGDFTTLARTPSVNPLTILMVFQHPIKLTQSHLRAAHPGRFSIEVAANETDFKQQLGSYEIVVSRMEAEQNKWANNDLENIEVQYLKLSFTRTTGDDYVHIRDWDLFGLFDIVESTQESEYAFNDCPPTIHLAVGDDYALEQRVNYIDKDNSGYFFSNPQRLPLKTANPAIATIDDLGYIHAVSPGTTYLILDTDNPSDSILLCISGKNHDLKAAPITSKVLVIIENPVVPNNNGATLQAIHSWYDPEMLNKELQAALQSASHQRVNYEIVETIFSDTLFSKIHGASKTVEQWDDYYTEHDWGTLRSLHEDGALSYDYEAMLDYHAVCEKANNKEITELWIWTHPMAGMYEARMAGPEAFWINGTVINNSNCTVKLPIMGFNYERTFDLAMHSYGHRVESTMDKVFIDWHPKVSYNNAWHRFITYDLTGPAHVGNIHYPPNGTSDYDYDNTELVTSYFKDWGNYPFLGSRKTRVTCEEWSCSHQGYMNWWFDKLPHFQGIHNNILNNWWHYIVDYDDAIAYAQSLDCRLVNYCSTVSTNTQLFEKPQISFECYPSIVTDQINVHITAEKSRKSRLALLDINGQVVFSKVVDISNQLHYHQIDVTDLPAGNYFVQLSLIEIPTHYLSRQITIVD